MSRIKIFSDSTCDLPKDLIDQYDISIIPLYVTFGETAYRDGVEMTTERMYKLVDEQGSLPKTAAPSPADFMAAFEPFVREGRDILYIGLSSELSSTQQNAKLAADMLQESYTANISVFDSLNLATGIGLQVMKAVRAAEAGQTVDQIVHMLEAVRPQVETEFIIDTLDYLYKGGRCSGLTNLLGSLLKIRPSIKVVNGKMTPANKTRGKREKALESLLNNALQHADEMDGDMIFVTHSMCYEDAVNIRAELLARTNTQHVYISDTGCVISSHCGAKTLGIVYAKKS
ncbi:DegV family protein [Paenibacillus sp. 481]|uniref:DegV family protein n=1 Tax=Paenibacillus sp. 481 TaxID=2835869 RepID=UPI001E3C3128|nr:DegV family protein [Paenibacillus sp. 481]UHA72812.1 DegV family protein [Paenibacillus sp. 481]